MPCYHTSGVSCPYFDPVAPQAHDSGPETARLPLGGVWDGLCRVDPDHPCEPDPAALLRLCNLGYARGECARFPGGDAPDAVRFAVTADDPATVRICYVIERDHHPFAHGRFENPAALDSPLLVRQAQAYLESYRRRKKEASGV